LVTGKDTFLGNEICRSFLEKGDQVATSVPPRQELFPALEQDKRLLVFPWNRRSPVAAKNFLLQTDLQLTPPDAAWVLITPIREAFSLGDQPPLAIDEAIDAQIKGLVYLVRELLTRQAANPALALHFVFFEPEPPTLPPLGALEYFGLRGMISSVLASARKKGLSTWAYDSLLAQPEAYVTWLLTARSHLPGRWNVHGEKKSLMGTLFAKKDNA